LSENPSSPLHVVFFSPTIPGNLSSAQEDCLRFVFVDTLFSIKDEQPARRPAFRSSLSKSHGGTPPGSRFCTLPRSGQKANGSCYPSFFMSPLRRAVLGLPPTAVAAVNQTLGPVEVFELDLGFLASGYPPHLSIFKEPVRAPGYVVHVVKWALPPIPLSHWFDIPPQFHPGSQTYILFVTSCQIVPPGPFLRTSINTLSAPPGLAPLEIAPPGVPAKLPSGSRHSSFGSFQGLAPPPAPGSQLSNHHPMVGCSGSYHMAFPCL